MVTVRAEWAQAQGASWVTGWEQAASDRGLGQGGFGWGQAPAPEMMGGEQGRWVDLAKCRPMEIQQELD